MCQCQVNSVGVPAVFRGMGRVQGVGFDLSAIGGLFGDAIGGAAGDIVGGLVNTGIKIGVDIGTQTLVDQLGFGGQKVAVGTGSTKAVTGTSGNTLTQSAPAVQAPAQDNTLLIVGAMALAAILLTR